MYISAECTQWSFLGPPYYFGISNKLSAHWQAAKKLVAASNVSVNGRGISQREKVEGWRDAA